MNTEQLLAALHADVEIGWRRLAGRHQPALDKLCGTCGKTWPCRTYRASGYSASGENSLSIAAAAAGLGRSRPM